MSILVGDKDAGRLDLSVQPFSEFKRKEEEREVLDDLTYSVDGEFVLPDVFGQVGLDDIFLEDDFHINQLSRLEEPTPLNLCFPPQPNVSDWVFHKVK